MSWTGLLRPGDSFPPALSSRLAVMRAESGSPLRRYYGSWSEKYRRFTSNLSSAKIRVRTLEPGEPPGDGIHCIVLWVDSRTLLSSGPGSVCAGDGWPVELWDAFTSALGRLPPGSIAEKLESFRDSRIEADNPIVANWRATLREGGLSPSPKASAGRGGWIPVPSPFQIGTGTTACIVSWDPAGQGFPSLSDALHSVAGSRYLPDRTSQARYFLECTLSRLHGVTFGPHDALEDPEFAKSSEVTALQDSLRTFEREHIAHPGFGLLDRRG
jgi:hypothetical protein